MTCPECEEELGDKGYGIFHCPQCSSRLRHSNASATLQVADLPKVLEANLPGSIVTIRRHAKVEGAPSFQPHCIGCQKEVEPGVTSTGTMIFGLAFRWLSRTKTDPYLGIMETFEKVYILGGGTKPTFRKVGFFSKAKGYLCDSCCGNNGWIKDNKGKDHPIITIDARCTGLGTIPAREIILSTSEVEARPLTPITPGMMRKATRSMRPSDVSSSTSNSRDNNWLNVGRSQRS